MKYHEKRRGGPGKDIGPGRIGGERWEGRLVRVRMGKMGRIILAQTIHKPWGFQKRFIDTTDKVNFKPVGKSKYRLRCWCKKTREVNIDTMTPPPVTHKLLFRPAANRSVLIKLIVQHKWIL